MVIRIGKLFMVTGPSGVGKGTILGEFLKNNPQVKYSISHTTRNPRPGEAHGINYFFVNKDEFVRSIEKDEFLEYAQYGDNYYGTSKNAVQDSLSKGVDVVLEIEAQGAKQVMEKEPNVVSVFIMPPSLEELESRLRGRKTESEGAILRRLDAAKSEIEDSKLFKYKIENDTVQNALARLQKIYDSEAV